MSFAFRTGFVTAKRTGKSFSFTHGFRSNLKAVSICVAVIIGLGLVGITGGTIGPGFVFLVDCAVFGFARIVVVVEQNPIHGVTHVFPRERGGCISFSS